MSKRPRPAVRKPRKPAARKPNAASSEQGQRLQKVLASAGIGSRRQCEELISAGRVEVDRRVVTELGTRVDPVKQQVRVDGVPLPTAKLEYFAVNKPAGVLSTNRDPSGRPRVIDLLPARDVRLFTIGRLDLHSDGLILVTNDGELANRLTHPRYGVAKTYRVTVAGQPDRDVLTKLKQGVHLAEGMARAERIELKSVQKGMPCWKWSSARGRIGRFAAYWPAWGTRSCGLRGSPWGRCGWARCPRVKFAGSRGKRSDRSSGKGRSSDGKQFYEAASGRSMRNRKRKIAFSLTTNH